MTIITKGMGAIRKIHTEIKERKRIKEHKKGKFPETESLTDQAGPYVGDVGSEGKKQKKEIPGA